MADTWAVSKPTPNNLDTEFGISTSNNPDLEFSGVQTISKSRTPTKTVLDQKQPGEILKYPYEQEALLPARMKFTVHQIQAYQIDPKAIANKFDVPLLGIGGKQEPKASISSEANIPDELAYGSAQSNKGDTQTVGGGQGNARANMQSTLEANRRVKDKQFGEDQFAGSSEQRATNLRTRKDPKADEITMYLPPALVYPDGVQYNPVALGPAGQAGLGALNNGASLLSAVGNAVTEGVESIFGLVAGSLSEQAAQVAAARATQFVPREGVRAALQTATQTGVNPGTRIIFEQPQLRTFTFQFKLVATSAAEATQIEKIIKSFRKELYPETIDIGNGLPIGYKFPNVYKIEFGFRGGKLRVPNILFSYLVNIQTSINGTSGVFHYDGTPTEVDLTLIFQEYRALSRQDVEAGF